MLTGGKGPSVLGVGKGVDREGIVVGTGKDDGCDAMPARGTVAGVNGMGVVITDSVIFALLLSGLTADDPVVLTIGWSTVLLLHAFCIWSVTVGGVVQE